MCIFDGFADREADAEITKQKPQHGCVKWAQYEHFNSDFMCEQFEDHHHN